MKIEIDALEMVNVFDILSKQRDEIKNLQTQIDAADDTLRQLFHKLHDMCGQKEILGERIELPKDYWGTDRHWFNNKIEMVASTHFYPISGCWTPWIDIALDGRFGATDPISPEDGWFITAEDALDVANEALHMKQTQDCWRDSDDHIWPPAHKETQNWPWDQTSGWNKRLVKLNKKEKVNEQP